MGIIYMRMVSRGIEPSCSYCARGTDIGNGEIICLRRGIVAYGGFCRDFRYEPTKRVPERRRRPPPDRFSKEDFEL